MTVADPTDVPRDASGWALDSRYARLGEAFHSRVRPTPVRSPRVVVWNESLAADLGLAGLPPDEAAGQLSGVTLPPGADPVAQAYAGHQFGHFTMLGDGRAILLGEQVTPTGVRYDVQLKGSGRTPYSRGGDGRAALGPMLREYVVSEAMHALGIPTTRSLAVVATGEPVFRETPKPGAVLTRIAESHVRVGTFQYLAARGDDANVKVLADYTIERHYPHLAGRPAIELFEAVLDRQVALVTKWLSVGFIHGVMNTDNMAVSGETIDYGPCAFLDAYDPGTVFSSIDAAGRYAYGNQPAIAQWNLARFAETLLPLIDADTEAAIAAATEVLNDFPARFEQSWQRELRQKLGLESEQPGDAGLTQSLLDTMHKSSADWTHTLSTLSSGRPLAHPELVGWQSRWRARLEAESRPTEEILAGMRRVNPAAIPRNHLVEAALSAASDRNDLGLLHELLRAVTNPYDYDADHGVHAKVPPPPACAYQTFCGT